MPYELYKVGRGYKVGKSDGKPMSSGRMYASDKPLTKEMAKKQMSALYASERQAEFRTFEVEKGLYKVGRSDKKKLPTGRLYSTNKKLTKTEARQELKKVKEKYR